MNTIITPEVLKSRVPAAFATEPSSKMTDKYIFVPTTQIIENFQKEGWEISSARQSGKTIHSPHEIRMRNGQMPKVGDSFLEAIIKNSHNGFSSFSVSAGLHRLVCENGLTVPESVSQSFNVRHKSFNLDDVKRLTDEFAVKLPIIESSIMKMSDRLLTEEEMHDYVVQATKIRWADGKAPKDLRVSDILKPHRQEDTKNDMWTTFNVVQEKFIRGGIKYKAGKKFTTMREMKNIFTTNKINTELWELAESYC
jgi:hypothetical protein